MIRLAVAFAAVALAVAPARPQQPEVLYAVVPFYPVAARAARISGVVVVEVRVGADGAVASAGAESGHPLLRKEAVRAAELWRFKPAAGGATARLTFDFRWEVSEEELKSASPHCVIISRPKPPETVSHIEEGDEGKTCELHGLRLERDKVRIGYGLLAFDGGYQEAAEARFPHSHSWVGGGCVVSDESPKYAEVLYCRACRAAEQKWRGEQRAEPDDE